MNLTIVNLCRVCVMKSYSRSTRIRTLHNKIQILLLYFAIIYIKALARMDVNPPLIRRPETIFIYNTSRERAPLLYGWFMEV